MIIIFCYYNKSNYFNKGDNSIIIKSDLIKNKNREKKSVNVIQKDIILDKSYI